MSATRGQWLPIGSRAAMVATIVRTQRVAAATTALYRNQLVHNADAAMHGDHGDGEHDFDFYFGRWRVHNERLKQRLAGSNDWQRFEAIQDCRPILGGLANIDEFVTDEFGPVLFLGMTLRLFDRDANQWSIYWASNRQSGLDVPVVGAFVDGVGRFEGDGVHEGVPVRVRFIWSDIGPERAYWEQAFSIDGGHTWETNWRMRMTRLAAYQPALTGAYA
jgi:hypothetical protein